MKFPAYKDYCIAHTGRKHWLFICRRRCTPRIDENCMLLSYFPRNKIKGIEMMKGVRVYMYMSGYSSLFDVKQINVKFVWVASLHGLVQKSYILIKFWVNFIPVQNSTVNW